MILCEPWVIIMSGWRDICFIIQPKWRIVSHNRTVQNLDGSLCLKTAKIEAHTSLIWMEVCEMFVSSRNGSRLFAWLFFRLSWTNLMWLPITLIVLRGVNWSIRFVELVGSLFGSTGFSLICVLVQEQTVFTVIFVVFRCRRFALIYDGTSCTAVVVSFRNLLYFERPRIAIIAAMTRAIRIPLA